MNKFATQLIAPGACLAWASAAFAHEGHGLKGIHWHATDAWGFVAVAGMSAVAVWLSKK